MGDRAIAARVRRGEPADTKVVSIDGGDVRQGGLTAGLEENVEERGGEVSNITPFTTLHPEQSGKAERAMLSNPKRVLLSAPHIDCLQS